MANKQQYSLERIKEALIRNKGFISQAANYLKCDQVTIRNYIARYPELNDVLKEQRESMLDFAESQLLTKIKDKDATSIIFFLKTQGRTRGYQDKIEVESENKNKITINFNNE